MGKKKRMVLLVLGIIILGIAIYQYPLQKALAQKSFETYIDKQGIDPDNIAIKKPVKDWKQGGYLIVVTFNDDINNKYYYHYEVWTHKKGEPLLRIPVKRRARSGGTVRPFQRKRRSRSILNGVKRRPSVLSDQRSQFLTELRPLVS